MNFRVGNVRVISEDTYQVMMAMLDRLQAQHDSFCAEIEANHKIEEASEFLAPYVNRLEAEGDDYPLPHDYITIADGKFLEGINVQY